MRAASAPGGAQRPLRPLRDDNGTPAAPNSQQDDCVVRVALRIRPMVAKEKAESARGCLTIEPDGRTVVLGKDRSFAFDKVLGPEAGQEETYLECVRPLVDSVFLGFNSAVMAYGQTGSGKTYCMGSGAPLSLFGEELGIIPRAIAHLFEGVEALRPAVEFRVRCSFLEILNEEVRDLLNPDVAAKSIAIRERPGGGIYVSGSEERPVADVDELGRLLESGAACRTTGQTGMNAASSRSHSIFTVVVAQRPRPGAGGVDLPANAPPSAALTGGLPAGGWVSAKLHCVDLAGSERNKRTLNAGARFKESVTINQGLLALGQVIAALTSTPPGRHIPYRDSKLTRLLQDALGGNSRTAVVACVSPADVNLAETLNTLKYACRARRIRNTPVINHDAPPAVDPASGDGDDISIDSDAEAVAAAAAAAESAAVDSERRLLAAQAHIVALQRALRRQRRGDDDDDDDDNGDDNGGSRRPLTPPSAELESLRLELADAREDLARDELIFAEKVREIAALRREVAALAADRATLTGGGFHFPVLAPSLGDESSTGELEPSTAVGSVTPTAAAPLLDAEDSSLVVFDDGAAATATTSALLPAPAPSTALVAMEEAIAAAEAEKSRLAAAKAAVEAERERLVEEAAATAHAHGARTRALEQQLAELMSAVAAKERLAAALAATEAESRALSSEYSKRMASLQQETVDRAAEVAALKAELASIDGLAAQSEDEKRKLRDAGEARVKRVEAQLHALGRQQREHEAAALERLRAKSGARIAALEAELTTLRSRSDALRVQLRDAGRRNDGAVGGRARELVELKRTAEASLKKIRALEAENAAQRAMLSRRRAANEAVTPSPGVGGKRVAVCPTPAPSPSPSPGEGGEIGESPPPAVARGGGPVVTSKSSRMAAYSDAIRRATATPRRGSSGILLGGPPPPPATAPADADAESLTRAERWAGGPLLDAAVSRAAAAQDAREQLSRQAAARSAVAAHLVVRARERASLQAARERAGEALSHQVAGLAAAMAEVDRASAHFVASASRDPRAAAEVDALHHQRLQLATAHADAARRLRDGPWLPPEQEAALTEVDDALDALAAESEYLAAAEAEARQEMATHTAEGDKCAARAAQAVAAGPAALVAACAARVAAAQRGERAATAAAAAAEMAAGAARRDAADAAAAALRATADAERRVAALSESHDRSMMTLMRRGTPGGDGGGSGGSNGDGLMAVAANNRQQRVTAVVQSMHAVGGGLAAGVATWPAALQLTTGRPATGVMLPAPAMPPPPALVPSSSPVRAPPPPFAAGPSLAAPIQPLGILPLAIGTLGGSLEGGDRLAAAEREASHYRALAESLASRARGDALSRASGREREAQLEGLARSLIAELSAAKRHNPVVAADDAEGRTHTVRVSSGAVRPLTAERVADLRASAAAAAADRGSRID